MSNNKKNPPHAFGQAVIYFREKKGWKQYNLAKAAGRQANEVKRIEEAKGSPKIDTMLWVAEALGIHPTELFNKTLEFMDQRAEPK